MRKRTLSREKELTWKAFSEYVRRRDEGKGCVTCGKSYEWKVLQAGHFIGGRNNSILFDERGVWGQCYICNIVKKGSGPEYYKFMLSQFGQDVIDDLIRISHETKKFTHEELQAMREDYKERIKLLTK